MLAGMWIRMHYGPLIRIFLRGIGTKLYDQCGSTSLDVGTIDIKTMDTFKLTWLSKGFLNTPT